MNFNLIHNLAEVFRKRRKVLSLTQVDLAALSGIDRHSIVNFEKGIGNPTIKVLEALSVPLGIRLKAEVEQTGKREDAS